MKNLSRKIEPYTELSYTYGSDLPRPGHYSGNHDPNRQQTGAAELVKYISEQLSSGRWYGTQTVSWALMSVGKYLGPKRRFQGTEIQLSIGQSGIGERRFYLADDAVESTCGRREKEVSVQNTSKGVLFARLILRGQPAVGETQAAANDLKIAVQFKQMNGTPIDIKNLAQGTDFYAEVTVTPRQPAHSIQRNGFGADIPFRMGNCQFAFGRHRRRRFSSEADYIDIRDDRVNTFFDLRERETKVYRVHNALSGALLPAGYALRGHVR